MLKDISNRRVFRVISGYAVVCFIILQIADVAFEPLGIGNGVLRVIIAVMLLSLPLVGYLSWIFDVEPGSKVARTKTSKPRLEAAFAFFAVSILVVGTWLVLRPDDSALPPAGVPDQVNEGSIPAEQPATSVGTQELNHIPQNSIAILPFKFSSDSSKEVAEGIHTELLNQLITIENLAVTARTSVVRYTNSEQPITEIARELKVANILTGSVRTMADQLRVTVELTEAGGSQRLWGQSYNRSLDDPFRTEADIALRVANALQINLSDDLSKLAPKAGTENPIAHRAYLKSVSMWKNFSPTQPIHQLLDKALAADSDYADALAYRAWIYSVESDFGQFDGNLLSERQRMDKLLLAESTAKRALAVDASQSLALQALAGVAMQRWQWREALYLAKRCHELTPNDYRCRTLYGTMLMRGNRIEEAVPHLVESIRLSPFDVANASFISDLFANAGKWDIALQLAQSLRERDPASIGVTRVNLSRAIAMKDFEAFEILASEHKANLFNPALLVGITYGYYKLYGESRANEYFSTLEATESEFLQNPNFKFYSALARGDETYAIDYLTKDMAKPFPQQAGDLAYQIPKGYLDTIAHLPEFQALVKRARTPRPDFPPKPAPE